MCAAANAPARLERAQHCTAPHCTAASAAGTKSRQDWVRLHGHLLFHPAAAAPASGRGAVPCRAAPRRPRRGTPPRRGRRPRWAPGRQPHPATSRSPCQLPPPPAPLLLHPHPPTHPPAGPAGRQSPVPAAPQHPGAQRQASHALGDAGQPCMHAIWMLPYAALRRSPQPQHPQPPHRVVEWARAFAQCLCVAEVRFLKASCMRREGGGHSALAAPWPASAQQQAWQLQWHTTYGMAGDSVRHDSGNAPPELAMLLLLLLPPLQLLLLLLLRPEGSSQQAGGARQSRPLSCHAMGMWALGTAIGDSTTAHDVAVCPPARSTHRREV